MHPFWEVFSLSPRDSWRADRKKLVQVQDLKKRSVDIFRPAPVYAPEGFRRVFSIVIASGNVD
jgi:hypothetical protein